MKKIAIDKDLLVELYVDKRKTAYEIAEILQVNRSTITRNLKKYNIDINPKQRKYELLKKAPFTKEQKEFLIGTLLGDGNVHPHGRKNKSYRFTLGHCEEQKELTLWSKSILGNFVNTIRKTIDKRSNSIMYSFTTITHNEFKFYYNLFYENNIKVVRHEIINYLTPFALAVWIMDDGTLNNKVNLRLATDGFTESENIMLQDMLKINFYIKSKVCKYNRKGKEYCYLSVNKENTIKAHKIVEKYFIDCMKYKLYTDSSTTNMPKSEINSDVIEPELYRDIKR